MNNPRRSDYHSWQHRAQQSREDRERKKGLLSSYIEEEPKPGPWRNPMADVQEEMKRIASMNIDSAGVSKAISKMGVSIQEAEREFRAFGNAYMQVDWDEQPKASRRPKVITDVILERSNDWLDISSVVDRYDRVMFAPDTVTYRDQDGDPLPPKLVERLEEMARAGGFKNRSDIVSILEEWNHWDGDLQESQGHLPHCLYRGSDHVACTCQPPTIFGKVRMWRCSCCDLPRADTQYGLCDGCEAHQYGSKQQVSLDHEDYQRDA